MLHQKTVTRTPDFSDEITQVWYHYIYAGTYESVYSI
jgi:hypothetical protein